MATKDIAESIRAGKELLARVEMNNKNRLNDPSIVELKHIIFDRIAELERELQAEQRCVAPSAAKYA